MLFEATVQINDDEEFQLFRQFTARLVDYRKDPFTTPVETPAARFDREVPVETPPTLPAAPAPVPAPELEASDFPTEKEAVDAFLAFASRTKPDQHVKLLQAFNVERVSKLSPSQRVAFIEAAANAK